MSDERHRPDVRSLWQSQADESTSMSLDDLRTRASRMNRLIRYRALIAGLAFLIFIGLFSVTVTWRVSALATQGDIRTTQSIFLVGAGLSFWLLMSLLRRVRGEFRAAREPSACAAFYRSELKRQRDFSRRSAVWVPLAFTALWAGVLLVTQFLMGIMIIIWVLFVPFWVYRNLELAKRSQCELAQLSANFGELIQRR